MRLRLRHVALVVRDLRGAESHYAALFAMAVLFRQVQQEGGWVTLPPGETSDTGMVALHRDDLVLALFSGTPGAEQLHALGVFADEAEIEAIASRMPVDGEVEARRSDWLAFVDRYGVRWQLSTRPYGAGPAATARSTPSR